MELKMISWKELGESQITVESVIKDLKEVDSTIWVETIERLILKFYPENDSEFIKLGQARRIVQRLAEVRHLDINHPSIFHYQQYPLIANQESITSVCEEPILNVNDRITQPRYTMMAPGDRYDGEPCFFDRMEMDKRNWLLGRKRLLLKGYSKEQLEAIIANCSDMATLIGASLIWASSNPSEDVFEQAADMALVSSIDDLWSAYNTIGKGFVAVVIAIVHYELLTKLEVGQYFPSIEIVEKNGEFFRKYGQCKRS